MVAYPPIDAGERAGATSQAGAEMRGLKRENLELRRPMYDGPVRSAG